MSDYVPVTTDQMAFTATAAAALTGGQLVEFTSTANNVAATSGTLRAVGVVAHDAASGSRVTVYVLGGQIHEVAIKDTVVIAAGAPIVASDVATSGRVMTGTLATVAAAGTLIGIALVGGTGNAGGTVKARFLGI